MYDDGGGGGVECMSELCSSLPAWLLHGRPPGWVNRSPMYACVFTSMGFCCISRGNVMTLIYVKVQAKRGKAGHLL